MDCCMSKTIVAGQSPSRAVRILQISILFAATDSGSSITLFDRPLRSPTSIEGQRMDIAKDFRF